MRSTQPLFRLSLIALLASASASGFAAGFMLNEQNATQTGDFGAGGAAIAEDASTAWFNPAGLVRIDKPQVVFGGNEIAFQTRYSGLVSYSNSDIPVSNEQQYVSNVAGGTSSFVPFFHAAYPINQNLVSGFSVTTPFGLATNYDDDTFVRYAATTTKLKTIDVSPSLGIKLTNKTSFGFGVDFQRLLATFDSYAGTDPEQYQNLDTYSHNVASDWAEGWHTGLLYQPTNTTRFGLAYHSKFVHHADGYSLFTGPLADPVNGSPSAYYYGGDARTTVYFPASTMLSSYHDMNNRWAVMGSVVYTQWDIFNTLSLQNLVDANSVGQRNLITVTVPQNFHNTWRFSTGTAYKVDEQWLIRTGIGYDESPTNNSDRNLRLPDGDRYAVALGGRYIATKNLTLDAGYTHEFIKPARIDNTGVQDTQSVYVAGKSYSHADIFGLQMTYSFT